VVVQDLDKPRVIGAFWGEVTSSFHRALGCVGTIIIAYITKALVGLRPTEEIEIAGLDLAEHGEEGYHGG